MRTARRRPPSRPSPEGGSQFRSWCPGVLEVVPSQEVFRVEAGAGSQQPIVISAIEVRSFTKVLGNEKEPYKQSPKRTVIGLKMVVPRRPAEPGRAAERAPTSSPLRLMNRCNAKISRLVAGKKRRTTRSANLLRQAGRRRNDDR